MSQDKPVGYITRILFIDAETSGISFNGRDPSFDPESGTEYQAVSWGLVVADAQTLKVIDKLYIEVKWNGTSGWSPKAQAKHGLSLKYLEENGTDEEEAVVDIVEFIVKHWGVDGVVCLGGHNVATFDRYFLTRLLDKYELPVKFGSKTVDTNAIGFAVFGTHNSDDFFEAVNLPPRDPNKHNSLIDADYARQAVRAVRQLFSACLDD